MVDIASIERKTFDFLAALTGIIALLYVGSAVWAFVTGVIKWEDFTAGVGGPSAMLVGYWVRGAAK